MSTEYSTTKNPDNREDDRNWRVTLLDLGLSNLESGLAVV